MSRLGCNIHRPVESFFPGLSCLPGRHRLTGQHQFLLQALRSSTPVGFRAHRGKQRNSGVGMGLPPTAVSLHIVYISKIFT